MNDSPSNAPEGHGLTRRIFVQGAAWAAPTAALAAATPACAASPEPTLAFTASSYSGIGCGTISTVQVTRTRDGTVPDPGKTVGVTLVDGYTFAHGATSYAATTDADGLITLPDIVVPAVGGNSSFAASSDVLAATAPVLSSPSAQTGIYQYNYRSGATSGPTAHSLSASAIFTNPTGENYIFQNPDGSLYRSDGVLFPGTESGVDTSDQLVALATGYGSTYILFKKSDGIHTSDYRTPDESGPIKNSSSAIKIVTNRRNGNFLFQNADGTVHYSSGVVVPGTEFGVDTGRNLLLITVNNYQVISVYNTPAGLYEYNNFFIDQSRLVPNSESAMRIIRGPGSGGYIFQKSDGSLHFSDGTLVAGTESGVDTGDNLVATRIVDYENAMIFYKKSDGIYQVGPSSNTASGPLPNSSSVVAIASEPKTGTYVFHSSDGTIRDASGVIVPGTESGVDTRTHLIALSSSNNQPILSYKKSPRCGPTGTT
ncbi:hypothetical protein C5C66_02055 [Rathayibacter toxicus]|uniref:Big-1 domain-containing protein n=1 Tax=Rathayibacter toxicus TaxID=145458 RepID=A0A0C5B8J6_9MICO|nr:hypothetical protein [Rathayibacter toxicus]AJM77098.1 hypothetical protein TI83_02240 [Rathayibacter toxicus]ALS57071.1 hypothetical protein APU90_04235 [Rathayibacter toxicus]KKM46103.1 hypothetical protein VT73_03250 [Rathayibacter toxicus]PPG23055.1 hypothetical protein C5D15_02035 [Rathayibacter toxicus]PPG47637.1 hypothetical protein C5D16_02030 [Rathayibacter toxicus]